LSDGAGCRADRLQTIVVVGASLAGLRAAESVRRAGFEGSLTLVDREAAAAYDRPPLSKGFLDGSVALGALQLRRSAGLDAEWVLGRSAIAVDAEGRSVRLDDGSELPYDGLVIATGLKARRLPQVDLDLAGVHVLRTVGDAQALKRELAGNPRVVIIGGGFIGCEVASTCRSMGLPATIVSPLPLLVNALGPLSAAAAERARRHGVTVCSDGVAAVTGDGRVSALELSDGTSIPADVLVVAVGAEPDTVWLRGSGADIDDGVLCDATLGVSGIADAVACGDVARWPHPALGGAAVRVEHWTSATEQAVAAARRLVNGDGPAHAPVPSFWSDQFGTRLQGVGFPSVADDMSVVSGDPASGEFLAELHRSGQLVAAVSAGGPRALLPYRRELAATLREPIAGLDRGRALAAG
jgi:3-phenylpropionate/trans-cinnamate dioxygenase ferredoxin reductase subunit